MAQLQKSADETSIREQAYYFWEQDGRPEGREMEYWSRAAVAVAEKEQMNTLTKAPPKKKAAASAAKKAPTKTVKAPVKAKPKKR